MTQTLGTIGRYELLARLGAGGMGEVYLARATGTSGFEKQVVIKRILPHLAQDPEFVRRFIAEGKLVVRLRHAGIAQVLDMGEQDGVTFIAMEYVDGRNLGDLARLARASGIATPVELVATLVVKLLEALDYAHHAADEQGHPLGIIHRDVSPANVMISRAGEVKLLDFGIARVTERLHATATGAIRGKYSYMSPQQAAGAELDARSDLFSVGVLLWELLAGHRPFDGASDLLTLDKIRFFEPGPLCAAAPSVPPALGALVDRLLAKDPEQRFPTADAAMRALLGWLRDVGAVILARDLAAWVEAVLATLPEALRDRPQAALSLDDLLRLGLGAPGPVGPSSAPLGLASPGHTRTISASGAPEPTADSTPGPSPQSAPGGPVGAFSPAEAYAYAPLRPAPLSGRYERPGGLTPPGAYPGMTPPPGYDPVTGAPITMTAPPRPRSRALGLLVAFNVLLLAAVGWLVVRLASDDESQARADRTADVVAAHPAALPTTQVPPSEADTGAAPAPPDTPDVEAAAEDPSPVAAVPDVPVAPVPVVAGSAFGAALDALAPTLLVAEAPLTLRATPGGQIAIAGLGTAPSPRHLTARPGTVLRGKVTLDGHYPRPFEVTVGDEEQVHLTLKAIPLGTVTFRFFPANARVLIDDAPVATGGTNLVTRELSAGSHRLLLIGQDGRKLSKSFDVVEGKTTNLRTLDAESTGGGG